MKKNNLSKETIEFLKKSSTQNFLVAANEFVALLENKKIDKEVFFTKIHDALVELYSTGYKLEEINLKYFSEKSQFDIDTNYKNQDAKKITELGDRSFYFELLDPTLESIEDDPAFELPTEEGEEIDVTFNQVSKFFLADDFNLIYTNIKMELLKIEEIRTDESVESAFRELKSGFKINWGRNCISALRYFHYIQDSYFN